MIKIVVKMVTQIGDKEDGGDDYDDDDYGDDDKNNKKKKQCFSLAHQYFAFTPNHLLIPTF